MHADVCFGIHNSTSKQATYKTTRKATWPKEMENNAFTKPPNLTLAFCDLDLWPPDPQVRSKFSNRWTNRQVENIMLIDLPVWPGRRMKITVQSNSFWPRDAMHKRGLCRHAVSVCVSVTFVDHVKTNKDIFKLFSLSGSYTILVFPCRREPPYVECRCGRQKSRFWAYIWLDCLY